FTESQRPIASTGRANCQPALAGRGNWITFSTYCGRTRNFRYSNSRSSAVSIACLISCRPVASAACQAYSSTRVLQASVTGTRSLLWTQKCQGLYPSTERKVSRGKGMGIDLDLDFRRNNDQGHVVGILICERT